MLDIFFKDNKDYNNQLNPVEEYFKQLSFYISTAKGIPIDEAKLKAKEVIKKYFKDQPIKHFTRDDNGDKKVEDSTLLRYINKNIAEKNVLVPTFTAYVNAGNKKSIQSEFIFNNVKRRSLAKRQAIKLKLKEITI